jgi:predicted ABC-type exoprotein transport system permease subunit
LITYITLLIYFSILSIFISAFSLINFFNNYKSNTLVKLKMNNQEKEIKDYKTIIQDLSNRGYIDKTYIERFNIKI